MIRRTFRWLLGAVGALSILLALAIVAVRVVLTQIPERRADLTALVNRTTGLDVRLGELSARWGPTGPEIYARDVQIHAPGGGPRLARAAAVSISTDLKRVLTRGQLKSARVRLIGPEVRLVRTLTGLELEGQSQLPRRPDKGPMNSDTLPSGSLRIEDGRITVIDARPRPRIKAGVPGFAGLSQAGTLTPDAAPEVLLRLQGLNLNLQRDGDLLRFAGTLDVPNRIEGELRFSGSAQGRLDDLQTLGWRLSAEGKQVKLEHWGEFLSGRWRGLNPQGLIDTFTLALSGSGKQSPRFQVAAVFSGAGIDPVQRVPGLRGLAGELQATEAGGQARVRAQGFELDMPYRFREPITADTAAGEVSWSRAETGGWRIVARDAQAASAHGEAHGDLELLIPSDGSSRVLTLNAEVRNADVRQVRRYLPVDRLRNPRTLEWLDNAFVAGRAVTAQVTFDGPTRSFPFRNGEGEFHVTGTVEDATLHYGKGWPDLEQVSADVAFHNAGFEVTLLSGQVHGLQLLAGAQAHMPDLAGAELTVSAKARGDLGAGLALLRQSPIGPRLGRAFADLRGAGATAVQLDLFLPIKRMADRTYTVVADLGAGRGGSRLSLRGTEHELRALQGRLTVEDALLTARGVQATYLGGPVTIDMKPAGTVNVVYARGRSPAAALAQRLGVPQHLAPEGTLEWRTVTRVSPGGDTDTGERKPLDVSMQIDSQLEGLAVNLPAPLNKPAALRRALSLQLHWPQPDALQVRGVYGDLAQAQLRFDRRAAGAGAQTQWVLNRGHVQLGGGRARVPGAPGLTIAGAVDTLDLSGWLALRSGRSGGRPLSEYLRGVELTARELQLNGFRLPDVTASMVGGAEAWAVNVSGPRAQGTLLIPFDLTGGDAVYITMARLHLGEPRAGSGARAAGSGPDPRRWPPVKVSVRDFSAWNRRFGQLAAELVRTPEGLTLHSLSARSPGFVLTGSGAWTAGPAGQHSKLALRLESTDVLDTLQRLGYGASLAGKRGLATLDLHWPGAPDGQLISRLSGTMHVEVDDGQLTSVQPGAGRVFGLMSVTTLRRRLALDFSDLTDRGLAFDSVRGDFTLKDGDAYTSNLLLQGPAADIGVVGRTGLDDRDYDQTAVVTGNFGSSLPVAGALAGGPAVGAALLVFSQIFKQPLKGVARGYYRITGPWDDPTVERVEAEDVKKAEGAMRDAQHKAGKG